MKENVFFRATEFYTVIPNFFRSFYLHSKMCIILHAPSGKRKITARFMGHFRIACLKYEIGGSIYIHGQLLEPLVCLTYSYTQSARDSPQHVFFSRYDLAVPTHQSVRHFCVAIYETKYQDSYALVLDECTVKLLTTRNLRVWTEVFQTGCSYRASAD